MDEQHVLIIVGAVAISYGLVSALRLKGSRSWPSVQGRIIRSTKRLQHTDAGKLEDADIAYEYYFGEKTYTSKVIKIGGDMLSQPTSRTASAADLLLTKYPAGKVVDVYVNPKHAKVAGESGRGNRFHLDLLWVAGRGGRLYFGEITAFISRGVTWLRK